MARFVHRFVYHWRENQSDDIRTYAQVIEDYFADSDTEGETDNECS